MAKPYWQMTMVQYLQAYATVETGVDRRSRDVDAKPKAAEGTLPLDTRR